MIYVCCLSKISHHSNFLQALGITDANTLLNEYNKFLFTLYLYLPFIYILYLLVTQNILTPGTLVNRIVDMGISPASLIFPSCTNSSQSSYTADGVVDSLRFNIYNDNYTKPWSNEYLLVKHLTKSS